METWVTLLMIFGLLFVLGAGVLLYVLISTSKTETTSLKNLTPAAKQKDPPKDPPKVPTLPPYKCCWNRGIQSCTAHSDCDPGGEGCIISGSTTKVYGTVMCDTCESQGMTLAPDKSKCIPKPTAANVMARLRRQNVRRW